MLIEKDYCDYDTCVALRELGYVGSRQECECFGAYFNFGKDIFTDSLDNTEVGTNEYLRVPLYLAQKWLREEKHIDVLVYLDDLKGYFPFIRIWEGSWKTFINLEEMEEEKVSYSANYEEALLEGVRTSIKILQEE